MASAVNRGILVLAGVAAGAGTGASTARVFSKAGYRVALMARNADSLQKMAQELSNSGGDAAPFPVKAYDHTNIHTAFSAVKQHWPNEPIRAAVYNTGVTVFKPFLETTESDINETVQTSIVAAFAFAREAILAFKDTPIDARGKRGFLGFTSATAALRGNTMTSALAAGKFGARALSQSLNKEFGKENIHVSNVVIDGLINSERTQAFKNDSEWEQNEDVRLSPDSIAQAYLYLANQDRSAWTWELDLRPAHEKWS